MAHKSLINGVGYEISSGKTLINGTGYGIKDGRTLIGGTGYDISFVLVPEGATLNDCSWANISDISDAGTASNYWSVGDLKAIIVNGTIGKLTINETYYVYILGFDHNNTYEGNNRIHFGCFKTALTSGISICLVDSRYGHDYRDGSKYFNMNHSSGGNVGGWASCDMRADILGSNSLPLSPTPSTLLAAFPNDLRSVMKSVIKYSDNTGGGYDMASYVTSTTDYLFLLSEYEYQGAKTYANSAEQYYQTQYAYYEIGNSKLKYKQNSTSFTAYLWCRSVRCNINDRFCAVSYIEDGIAVSLVTYYSRGVAPGFCV